MSDIKDYVCSYGTGNETLYKLGLSLGLDFPQVYLKSGDMAMLSKAVRQDEQSLFCYLPFCHTVEAEALGADINLGDEHNGPRAKSYKYCKFEELNKLPEIDFDSGRIAQVLVAAKSLHESGEKIALEICGPFTVLNALIDVTQIIKGWRKNPESMTEVFNHIGRQLVNYIQRAKDAGVCLFSYGDPAGGLNILGPKLAETVTSNFTVPFLKSVVEVLDENTIIHLCPKTWLMLTGLGYSELQDIEVKCKGSYEEAYFEICDKANIIGHMCIQNARKPLVSNMVHSLVLNDRLDN